MQLPVPARMRDVPLDDPIRELLDDTYITPKELAARWRLSEAHLSNMRNHGKGPAYVKFTLGSVRYRVSEVIAWELEGHRTTGINFERVRLALRSVPGLPEELRLRIEAHLAYRVPDPPTDRRVLNAAAERNLMLSRIGLVDKARRG